MATDNNLKQHYLQAMGIQTWQLKTATTSFEPVQISVPENISDPAMPIVAQDAIETNITAINLQHSQVPESPADTSTDIDTNQQTALSRTKIQESPASESMTSESVPQHEDNTESPDLEEPYLKEIVTAINNCRQCPKRTDRLQAIAGHGKQNNVDVFIITDPPAAEEDRAGVYLPDHAGVLYQSMLKSVGLTDRCYVSGLLKCHSLELFVPAEEEIQQCFSFLSAQIKLLKPKVLVSFGGLPAQYLLRTKRCLNELINQLHTVNIEGNKYPLIVTYPPGFLLRNPLCKKQSLNDLIRIKQLVSEHTE